MTTLTHQIRTGLDQLRREGLRFPHGVHPLDFPGGQINIATVSDWENLRWNPPHQASKYSPRRYPVITGIDLEASEKPKLTEILTAWARTGGPIAQAQAKANCRDHCRNRITRKAYIADDLADEHLKRLRLAGTATLTRMDKWREHYRTRYREIAWWIDSRTVDQGMIDRFNSANWMADELWDGATWIPPGESAPFDDHEAVPLEVVEEHAEDPPERKT